MKSIVSILEIELNIDLYLHKPVQDLANQGQRGSIFPGNTIQGPIVNIQIQLTTFLQDEYNQSTYRAIARMNPALFDSIIQVFSQNLQFRLGKGVNRTVQWDSTAFKVNCMCMIIYRDKSARALIRKDFSKSRIFQEYSSILIVTLQLINDQGDYYNYCNSVFITNLLDLLLSNTKTNR